MAWYRSQRPFQTICRWLWPIPWTFSLPPQLTPQAFIDNPRLSDIRQDGMGTRLYTPLFARRDTPTRSIYRLYEMLCAQWHDLVSAEVEYIYFHPCPAFFDLQTIPDPEDTNPERYAILASTVEALVDAFNWRLQLGIQRDHKHVYRPDVPAEALFRAPEWTRKVPPLEKELVLCEEPKDMIIFKKKRVTPFSRRNISAHNGYFYSV